MGNAYCVVVLVLTTMTLMSSCAPAEPDDLCLEAPEPWVPADFVHTDLLRCGVVPELCDIPVDSIVRERDPHVAIDVVFVGDGYTEGAMASYRDRVSALIDELSSDPDTIVGRDPSLFNFHRVDLIASGPTAEERPLRSCVGHETGGSRHLGSNGYRVTRVAANAPAADLVVVIVANSTPARGSGAGNIIMRHEDSYQMLTHEMGHALVGLHDEYVEFDRRHYLADAYEKWTANPLGPNLSLSPDEEWDGLVDGAFEGGGRYAHGVYRPTDNCRMRSREDEFCPVCSAAIDGFLAGRRAASDGPPRCGVALGHEDANGKRQTEFFGRDANGLRSLSWAIDDAAPVVYDSAAGNLRFYRGRSRLPVWVAVSSFEAVDREVRVICVDELGDRSESSLTL